MSPADVIKQAALDGIALTLSTTGTIKMTGEQASVNRWLSSIRENKVGILLELNRSISTAKVIAKKEVIRSKPAQKMSYEDFLVAHREMGANTGEELERISNLKLIDKEIQSMQHLETWLGIHAGGITMISNSGDAIAAVKKLKSSTEIIGIDIETAKAVDFDDHPQAGLHPQASRIRLVQLFQNNDSGVIIIDCFATGYEWLPHLLGAQYVAHNAQFECAHFWHYFRSELNIECTMLVDRVLHGELHKLTELSAEHLYLNLSKALQTSNWSRPDLLKEQILYAAADAVAAKLLWQRFKAIFAESDDKYLAAYEFIKKLIYPVIRQAGIKFDAEGHVKVVAEWQKEEQETRRMLADLGLENPASVKQKQQWLAEHLSAEEILDWLRTEAGNLSTSAEALEKALHIPGAAPLARWSQISTRLSNFGSSLSEKVIDGHLYPNYRIAGMVTGRFGCNAPNIQNQPRNGFKHLYRVPDGCQFVTGDLSQIELRVAGLLSGDTVINDAYAMGCDLHREVAAERSGKARENVSKEERQAAKAINFGLIFGAGAKTLRQQAISSYGVQMSMDDAADAKTFFHSKYQRLSEWQREIVSHANLCGYSESPYIKLTRHYEERVYTHAMNFPVQAGAWEVLALAILYIDQRLPIDGSIKISHHVYDELCLVARDANVLDAAYLLRDGFLHGFRTVFPQGVTRGLVEIGAGKTWEDAGSVDNRIKEASL